MPTLKPLRACVFAFVSLFLTSALLAASPQRITVQGKVISVNTEDKTCQVQSGDKTTDVSFYSPNMLNLRIPLVIKDVPENSLTTLRRKSSKDDQHFIATEVMTYRPPRSYDKEKARITTGEASGLLLQQDGKLRLKTANEKIVDVELSNDCTVALLLASPDDIIQPGEEVIISGENVEGQPFNALYISVLVPDTKANEILATLPRIDQPAIGPQYVSQTIVKPIGRVKRGPHDYLALVKAYADAMITNGRDVYGKEHSPLFASNMNRRTVTMDPRKPPKLGGIRDWDRMWTGANPMHDMNLYQVMYALTEITGDKQYAAEADNALKWFFTHCQSPRGLMAWGEHEGWNFLTESPINPDQPHEYFRPWVLWDRSYALAPEASIRFAKGVWENQIADHETGLFSRHAYNLWDHPEIPSAHKGSEFPRHAGFYIMNWSEAYHDTKDPIFLTAIDKIVTTMNARRDPKTGLMPAQTKIPELSWPHSELSMAIDVWDAAQRVPADLSARMKATTDQTDTVFLSLEHDLSPGGHGFIKSANVATAEPYLPPDPKEVVSELSRTPYSYTWATGYGMVTDAKLGMMCLLRYQQVPLDGYRKLALAAADRYLDSEPDLQHLTLPLFPDALAEAIALQLGAWRLTGEQKYLDRAGYFAEYSADLFFDPTSPLPKVSANDNYYETGTGCDTLAMELLDYWSAKNKPDAKLDFRWSER